VTVESIEGEGSAFTLTLPLAEPIRRASSQAESPSDAMQEA